VLKVLNQLKDASNELQDEFYCQIAKQTNKNPSQTSTEKGWQMFMICLATFPPSDVLLPCLMSYCTKNLSSSVPNVPNYAELVLHRAPKSKELGDRKEVPTMVEIEALKRGGTVKIKVYFSDKKYIYCGVDSWTTFQNLREIVTKMIKMQEANDDLFDFYEVNEIKSSERVPEPGERVLDVLARWEHLWAVELASDVPFHDPFFIEFKKIFPYPIERPFDEEDTAMVALLYVEFVSDVVEDNAYPLCSEQDGVTLAALQLQEKFGDYPTSEEKQREMKSFIKENLSKFISDTIIETSSSSGDDLTTFVCLLYDKLKGYSQFEAQMSYLQFVRSWSVEEEDEEEEEEEEEVVDEGGAVTDLEKSQIQHNTYVNNDGDRTDMLSEEEEYALDAAPPRKIALSREILEPLNAIVESDSEDDEDEVDDEDIIDEPPLKTEDDSSDEVQGISHVSHSIASDDDIQSTTSVKITPPLRGGPPAGPPPAHARRVSLKSNLSHAPVQTGHGGPPPGPPPTTASRVTAPSVRDGLPPARGGPPVGPPPPHAKRVSVNPTPPNAIGTGTSNPKPDFLASIAAGGHALKKPPSSAPPGGGGGNPKPDFLASIAAGGHALKKPPSSAPPGGGGGNPKPDFLASIAAGGHALRKTSPCGGGGRPPPPPPPPKNDLFAAIAARRIE